MSAAFEEEKARLLCQIADEEQKLKRKETFANLMNRYYATAEDRLKEIEAQN